MEKSLRFLLCLGICVLATSTAHAQSKNNTSATKSIENKKEDGPIMYQFELDFFIAEAEHDDERNRVRSILDTLDITDRKRRQLLRDFYKNGLTKRLQKVLLVDTSFEKSDY